MSTRADDPFAHIDIPPSAPPPSLSNGFGAHDQPEAKPGAAPVPPSLPTSSTTQSPKASPAPPTLSPTTAALLSQFQAPRKVSFSKLTLNTGTDSSPFSSFNPYSHSPSNRCRSPSITVNPAFTFYPAAAGAYCPSPSQSSPRVDVQKANDTWEAQFSPFTAGKGSRASPTRGSDATTEGGRGGKFAWTYEENGHERDKGDHAGDEDESTSDEEESDNDEERKESERPPPRKPAPLAFDAAEPWAAVTASAWQSDPWPSSGSVAPSPKGARHVVTVASRYATPSMSPRSFVSTLTPKTRRPSLTNAPSVTVFPMPSPASVSATTFPVLHSTPTSPPPTRPSSGTASPIDPKGITKAPPMMSTAATAKVAGTAQPSPRTLAAAALLKKNTAYNKTIAATAAELFADLDTPAATPHRKGGKAVGFADERGARLADVHLVPDDFTQYPIPKKKGKKGKEKCRVM